MKYFLILSLWIISLSACQSNGGLEDPEKVKEEKNSFEIIPGERVGLITASSTESSLKKAYGARNISIRSIAMGEGFAEEGVVIFPRTREEAEIVWDVEAANGHPAFVRISRDSTRWHTPEGITVGTSLWELESKNGAPFTLNGFEWDYAGLVTSWEAGHFSDHFIIVLIPSNFDSIDVELLGDKKLQSDDPRLQPLDLKVGTMVVTFD